MRVSVRVSVRMCVCAYVCVCGVCGAENYLLQRMKIIS